MEETLRKRRRRSLKDLAREGVVWFLVPAAVHLAVILLLMHLHFFVAPPERREAVIDTSLEEIDIVDNPVEHLPPTNVRTSITSDRRLDWKALIKPESTQLKGPDERNILKMLEEAPDEPLTLAKVAVPVDGLSAMPRLGGGQESKSSVAAVMDAMGRELAKILTKRKVLLVWLFDESGSMRHSQQQIRQRVSKVYSELQVSAPLAAQAKLVSAVVSFGVRTHFILTEPTAKPTLVEQAIDRIPLDTSGVENVMAACREVLRRYRSFARMQRRALVVFIVTDECGDDVEHLEEVIAAMKAARARVFVLGGEARFQGLYIFPRRLSPKAPREVFKLPPDDPRRRKWLVPATQVLGRESAYPETLYAFDPDQNSPWCGWKGMSGFGFWALTRLARETGGVFYIFHGAKGPTYDPEVMQPYVPEYCSKKEYVARCKADKVRWVIHRLHDLLAEVPFRFPSWIPPSAEVPDKILKLRQKYPFYGSIRPGHIKEDLLVARKLVLRRLKRLNEIIKVLESRSLADHPHSPRRWEANRQLALADCYALRWSAKQYLLALEDWAKHPKLSASALYYIFRLGTPSHPAPIRGGEEAFKERREVLALYDKVIADHPGTPWADCARKKRRLSTYQVVPVFPSRGGGHYKPPPPPPKI